MTYRVDRLHHAIETCDFAMLKSSVKRIVKKNKSDLNTYDRTGCTAVMKAIQCRLPHFVKFLLQNGASVNVSQSDKCRPLCTALGVASLEHDLTYLKILCNAGADINKDGCDVALCTVAGYPGHLEAIKCLINLGADVNCADRDGDYPLMLASEHGHLDYVDALLKAGACVNVMDCVGHSALYLAAKYGHADIINVLASNGATLHGYSSKLSSTKRTALMAASWRGHLRAVQTLIELGADMEAVDDWDRTALSHALRNGHSDIVRALLAAGAKLHLNDEGPLLHAAAINMDVKCVEALLDHGANVNGMDEEGMTALHIIVTSEHNEVQKMVHLLLSAGAELEQRDDQGRTAVMLVAKTVVLDILLQAGAAVNAVDFNGYTPLHYACIWHRSGLLVGRLISAHADLKAVDCAGNSPAEVAEITKNAFAELLIRQRLALNDGVALYSSDEDSDTD